MKKVALISVFNKEGIVEFAKFLSQRGYDIYASGGTAKALSDAGVENTDIANLIGGGAILGHKVVTLAREIHAGLLADPKTDKEEMEKLGIPFIDLVCVDFYPLSQAIKETPEEEKILEKTDMGGPAMISSGAKGRRIVICDPTDRKKVMEWISAGEPDREKFIRKLCAKADFTVANYRLLSANFHSGGKYSGGLGESIQALRYGENAYQNPSSLFVSDFSDPLAISNFKIHAGNPSFINITDIDRLLQTITHLSAGLDFLGEKKKKMGVAVKHGNPCGASFGDDAEEVVKKIIDGNRRSIFGGAVMLNFQVDEDIAEILVRYGMDEERRRPLDVVVAPMINEDAMTILKRQNDRCLIVTNSALENLSKESLNKNILHRGVRGGWLEQPNYNFIFDFNHPELKTYGALSGVNILEVNSDTILAWAVCATSNSNTITLAKEKMLIANGVGQQDRVGAVELALKIAKQADHDVEGAIAVSDSFFPFPDAPRLLKDAGVKRILATSGSVNDKATIELFKDSKDCELLHIPDKVGRAFFGH